MAATWSELLDKVQMSGIYPDSKTFVDKPLKFPVDEILVKFAKIDDDVPALKEFLKENFDKEGEELISCTPAGFVERPEFLQSVRDESYREFAQNLNAKYKELCRKAKPDIKESPEKYSFLYVPGEFTVPGGRFRECYYWDTYWAVQGMLLCEQELAVKEMITNMIYLVERHGFVPNGGRSYFLNRSQPPMLIPIVSTYINKTNDLPFLREIIHTLEKEYRFWLENHVVSVTIDEETFDCFIYKVDTKVPRPESYLEDTQTAMKVPPEKREDLFADLASAAESGWDFSTRWYDVNKPTSLTSISTRNVVPVDLNAFLCWNTRLLKEFYVMLGDEEKAAYYQEQYEVRQHQLDKLFWDDKKGAWFDFHLKEKKRDTRFFVSMIVPMFTGCHGETAEQREYKVTRVLEFIRSDLSELKSYKCGVPTSMTDSGQQWDYPNAWPPLQHMWIRAFHQSSNDNAKKFAYDLASKWVRCCWNAWKVNDEHHMYEKYNAVTGEPGGGGEYEVQVGFGWTNGVILDLLALYPGLTSADDSHDKSTSV